MSWRIGWDTVAIEMWWYNKHGHILLFQMWENAVKMGQSRLNEIICALWQWKWGPIATVVGRPVGSAHHKCQLCDLPFQVSVPDPWQSCRIEHNTQNTFWGRPWRSARDQVAKAIGMYLRWRQWNNDVDNTDCCT